MCGDGANDCVALKAADVEFLSVMQRLPLQPLLLAKPQILDAS